MLLTKLKLCLDPTLSSMVFEPTLQTIKSEGLAGLVSPDDLARHTHVQPCGSRGQVFYISGGNRAFKAVCILKLLGETVAAS